MLLLLVWRIDTCAANALMLPFAAVLAARVLLSAASIAAVASVVAAVSCVVCFTVHLLLFLLYLLLLRLLLHRGSYSYFIVLFCLFISPCCHLSACLFFPFVSLHVSPLFPSHPIFLSLPSRQH